MYFLFGREYVALAATAFLYAVARQLGIRTGSLLEQNFPTGLYPESKSTIYLQEVAKMARLRDGEKSDKETQVSDELQKHTFGLRESELAQELGWERRTVNNYLHELEEQGKAYKEGRSWYWDS